MGQYCCFWCSESLVLAKYECVPLTFWLSTYCWVASAFTSSNSASFVVLLWVNCSVLSFRLIVRRETVPFFIICSNVWLINWNWIYLRCIWYLTWEWSVDLRSPFLNTSIFSLHQLICSKIDAFFTLFLLHVNLLIILVGFIIWISTRWCNLIPK